ncbi:hypothetical protein MNBD_PLANCTO02-2152 [hydrothermal vent metagenome]|uniref:Thioester reductase (TE) domain-containing protein n=1 Tax=hydrothermal vent metagenome TaxID=652676 RepID=A0A3B1DYU9_9ZZZZ
MEANQHIFLTGATGLIGQYLLRNFLLCKCSVTVLVRPTEHDSGRDRIEKVFDHFQLSGQLKDNLHIIEGELPYCKPDTTDRKKIAACNIVVHSAASLSFHKDARGEPWETNVEGTESLLQIATSLGVKRWIQISTAYVCGRQQGVVLEEPQSKSEPQNHYEASKRQAEEMIRNHPDLDWTILRPGIVVGDSQTGFTSTYQGIYRCLQSVAFLSKRIQIEDAGDRKMPLRFALSGNEQTNLIPVDWVAEAVTQLTLHADSSRKHFHLTPNAPITAKKLVDAVQEFYDISGIEFVGEETDISGKQNVFERIFERETKRLGPYFQNDPQFDRTTLDELCPHLKEVAIDDQFIKKLLTFAEDDQWAKSKRWKNNDSKRFNCKNFFEVYFPRAADDSQLVRIHDLNTRIGFEVTGEDGGLWVCELSRGNVKSISPTTHFTDKIDFLYKTDVTTLEEIVTGKISARDAFFKQRIDIQGDVERALLLSLLLEDLLREIPYQTETTSVKPLENICA